MSNVRTRPVDVCARIQAEIEARKLDWKTVARKAGVDETWLYRTRRLPRLTIRLDFVEAIAEVLGTHPRDLLYPVDASDGPS